MMNKGKIEIYKSSDGEAQLEVRFEQNTIWLSQRQIADLFGTEVPAINKHIKNILKEGELKRKATISKMEIVQIEGNRKVKRKLEAYNLDFIISIGYRVNSGRATQFRIWATQRLKDYLIQGYAINERRLEQKKQEVHYLRTGIRIMSRVIEETSTSDGYEWLHQYSKGLELLDDYDHETLDKKGRSHKKAKYPQLSEFRQLIDDMKTDFDSSIFGKEKDRSFPGSIEQISKGIGDTDFYPSLEEKAATLLYLIVKNHSFVDGNKRIGAACFLLFLERNNMLNNNEGTLVINNGALASLTLFVAASKPEEMEIVKRLIISILNRR